MDSKIKYMDYSPKLKQVMSEIKEILSRYDIAGIVVIHGNGKETSNEQQMN